MSGEKKIEDFAIFLSPPLFSRNSNEVSFETPGRKSVTVAPLHHCEVEAKRCIDAAVEPLGDGQRGVGLIGISTSAPLPAQLVMRRGDDFLGLLRKLFGV